jgi:diguanylate cyclase (GGDEF)-like protein
MISLKRYLDADPVPERLLAEALEAYRSTLKAVGNCGVHACPVPGEELQKALLRLEGRLTGEVTPALVQETREQAEAQLKQWGGRTAEYLKEKVGEVKDILALLARTTESVGERDQRYAQQLGGFTTRLQSIADLEDLTQVRASLVQSASELKGHVERMTQECSNSIAELKGEVAAYQTRLEEAERWALRDTLTGLDNRRNVEAKMRRRIEEERPFTLVVLDLNGFKQVNDACGHLAGDDLLRQFATELRSRSRSTDVVGRWGGDEFILVLDCGQKEAASHIQRIRQWVLGEYEVRVGTEARKVSIGASIGMAEWNSGEAMHQLLERADAAMYADKAMV